MKPTITLILVCRKPSSSAGRWGTCVKNVTLGAPGVHVLSLLQDHYCVPCVAVCKVNPEVGPIDKPSQEHLYRAPEPHQRFWDGYPVSLGLPGGVGGGGEEGGSLPRPPQHHSVLALTVRHQRPCQELQPTLWEVHPPPLPLSKGWPLPLCSISGLCRESGKKDVGTYRTIRYHFIFVTIN